MNISCGLSGIVDYKHPRQGSRDIIGAGFESVMLDISMFCSPGELENLGKPVRKRKKDEILISEHPEKLADSAKAVLCQMIEKAVRISAVTAPYLQRDTKRHDLSGLLEQLAEESIRMCGRIGCKNLIIRPLFAGIPEKELWKENKRYYLKLAQEAERNHVMILLENQCRDINGHLVRGICSDGREAARWVDSLNEAAGKERFGFCMDVGVCNLCAQNMYDFVQALGKRIKAVVLRDCDGTNESSMLPFTCVRQGQPQTDWLNLIRGLREIGFDGELIVDLQDTAASFSPILRPELVRMAKSVADYFKWQIEIENLLKKYPARVLFGAGNMCRNYMKCYGEKYPPLFTCDNNSALWESEFCGLSVKDPENLKNLTPDCAIFICNIYYREIEEQLRNMGIGNPIEFFNDEYMPSFYFDRLERRD